MHIKCDLGNIWGDQFSGEKWKNKAKKYYLNKCLLKGCACYILASGAFERQIFSFKFYDFPKK